MLQVLIGSLLLVAHHCCLLALLRHKVQLLVHLLLDQIDLILLHLSLGEVWGVRVEDIHSLEVQCTDAPHEGLLQVLLHHRLHFVTLVNLDLSIVKTPSQHFNLFAVIGADALNLCLDRLFEIFRFLLFTPCEVRFDPPLPKGSHALLLMLSQAMCNHHS